jgi:outer membrane scaffolding protein for murein synthesis (MipA/OmpV family)
MRFSLIFAVVITTFTSISAHAQSDPDSPTNSASPTDSPSEKTFISGDYLVVGAGAVYSPSYEGSNDYEVFPVPVIQGRIRGVTITPRAGGAAVNLIPDPANAKLSFSLGPVATYSANRDRHIDDPVVRAAGRLKADIAVGASGGVVLNRIFDPYDSVSASVDVKWDVHGPHGGMQVAPSVSYRTPLSKAVIATLAVSAKHVNDDYANYYYSVSPGQSAASGLPIFQAHAGWASVGTTLLLGYSLRGDLRKRGLSVFAVGGYTRLLNDARFNPYTAIRGSADQWIGGGGIAFMF